MTGTPDSGWVEQQVSTVRPPVPDQSLAEQEHIYDITPTGDWAVQRPPRRWWFRQRWLAFRHTAGAAVRAVKTGAIEVARWSRRPSGQLALPGALLAMVVAASGAAGSYLVPAAAPARSLGQPTAPPPSPIAEAPPSLPADPSPPPPLPTPGPTVTGGREAAKLAGWAAQISVKTQIPQVAIEAYGYAEFVLSRTQPQCHLRWTTLAAIGKVESDHGRAGGATVTSDGKAYPPIFGPPLNGQGGNRSIPDTDQGVLDNDPVWDRAIGPMQFIPATWQTWQTDADNDRVADPHDLDDSALAAAKYLCANQRDLSTTSGWQQAILAYNNVQAYAQQVFEIANDYGLRSR